VFAPGSLTFAETPCLQRLQVGRVNDSEPERTPSAAIAAIVIIATLNSLSPGRGLTHRAPLVPSAPIAAPLQALNNDLPAVTQTVFETERDAVSVLTP
jgi:hypothetical protein